jgi:hypothetical protein
MFKLHLKFVFCWLLMSSVWLNSQKPLPRPTLQTHAFDFARFLDNEVSPVKSEMDFFFTAFGSTDSVKLAESYEFLNKRSPKLFASLDDLPRKPETSTLIDTYLDYARFCMNARGTLKKWVSVSGRVQWAKRLGKPVPEDSKAVWDALLNIRRGYIQQTKLLLQKHNEYCARYSAAFELYPSERVLELFQNLKFGSAAPTAIFIDAVSVLQKFEKGHRYVFNLGSEMQSSKPGALSVEALKENINFGLPENSYAWHQMKDETQPDHQVLIMYSSRYSKPSAPLLLIRCIPNMTTTKSSLSLELYSVVPKFLQPLP